MATWYERLQWTVREARCFGPGFVMRHWTALRGAKRHQWTMKGVGDVAIRHGTTDAEVMRQVFERREYDISHRGQYPAVRARYDAICASGRTPLIIDAGANIGASALWFAREFPDARVIAVEPDPANAAACRANSAANARITLWEAAIGGQPGKIALENPSGHAWAPRTSRSASGEIRIVTIPELIASVPDSELFIVKIDIEGFEADLFASNTDWIDQAAAILIETHDWMLPGSGTSFSMQKAMGDRRFEVVLSGENLLYFNTAVRSASGGTVHAVS